MNIPHTHHTGKSRESGMNEYDLKNELQFSRLREGRLRWTIMAGLVVLGFLFGMVFQNERLSAQVVINTTKITTLEETFIKISDKLDIVMARNISTKADVTTNASEQK